MTKQALLHKSSVSAQERLGVLLEKEDEMDCLVGGANFLLKAIHHEAFMYENSQTLFTPSNCKPSCLLSSIPGLLSSYPAQASVALSVSTSSSSPKLQLQYLSSSGNLRIERAGTSSRSVAVQGTHCAPVRCMCCVRV